MKRKMIFIITVKIAMVRVGKPSCSFHLEFLAGSFSSSLYRIKSSHSASSHPLLEHALITGARGHFSHLASSFLILRLMLKNRGRLWRSRATPSTTSRQHLLKHHDSGNSLRFLWFSVAPLRYSHLLIPSKRKSSFAQAQEVSSKRPSNLILRCLPRQFHLSQFLDTDRDWHW